LEASLHLVPALSKRIRHAFGDAICSLEAEFGGHGGECSISRKNVVTGCVYVDEQQFIEESIKRSSHDNSWKRKIAGESTLLGRSYAQETWNTRKA
jgi:hypothetical protein